MKMKNLFLTFSAIICLSQFKAQCPASIAQYPAGNICIPNPTLTAMSPGYDQNQSSNTTCMANFSQNDVAQSFIPTSSTITGAGIYITSGSGTGTITISLYTNLPNMAGVMIATGTVVSGVAAWADVSWPSVAVTPGVTYYLVFTSTNGNMCIAGSTSNPYAGGQVYANTGFNSFPSFDYTFHTFAPSGSGAYLWSTGSTSASIYPTSSGVYNVTITVGSCTSTASQSITINTPPTVTANASSSVVCQNGTVTLTGAGANTYTWTGGVTNGVAFTPTVTGSYTVSGTNTLTGCTSTNIAVNTVTVAAPPTIAVNSGSVCAGSSFTIIPSGASTYTFSNGSAVVTPSVNSSYSVTGTSAAGCTATNSAISSVTVNPLPAVNAVTSASLICTGQTITVTAAGATTYTWNTSATGATISASPTITTTYTVTGENANGCKNTASVTQSVSACTGLQNAFIASNSHIYPNPTKGLVRIDLVSEAQIVILNSIGQVISNDKMLSGINHIDLSLYSNGIYFVKVIQDGNTETLKLIKE